MMTGENSAERSPAEHTRLPQGVLETAMRQAFELARRGPERGINPQVGCVILAPDGSKISEGWHLGAGTAHAEVEALTKADPTCLRGATAVVTLEPCNHQGLTGPCTEALIMAGIAEVVFAVPDPGKDSGSGTDRLRQAGIKVTAGLLGADGETLISDWLFAARHHRPRVTAKWGSSLDGRAAADDATSQWITGATAGTDAHKRRSAFDAIAVGAKTMIADNPKLTARRENGELYQYQPRPVVFGATPVPHNARLNSHPAGPVIQLDGVNLSADLASLWRTGIQTLLVEGGPTLVSSLLEAGLVDEIQVYLAPLLLGGSHPVTSNIGVNTLTEASQWDFVEVVQLGADVFLRALPRTTLSSNSPETKA